MGDRKADFLRSLPVESAIASTPRHSGKVQAAASASNWLTSVKSSRGRSVPSRPPKRAAAEGCLDVVDPRHLGQEANPYECGKVTMGTVAQSLSVLCMRLMRVFMKSFGAQQFPSVRELMLMHLRPFVGLDESVDYACRALEAGLPDNVRLELEERAPKTDADFAKSLEKATLQRQSKPRRQEKDVEKRQADEIERLQALTSDLDAQLMATRAELQRLRRLADAHYGGSEDDKGSKRACLQLQSELAAARNEVEEAWRAARRSELLVDEMRSQLSAAKADADAMQAEAARTTPMRSDLLVDELKSQLSVAKADADALQAWADAGFSDATLVRRCRQLETELVAARGAVHHQAMLMGKLGLQKDELEQQLAASPKTLPVKAANCWSGHVARKPSVSSPFQPQHEALIEEFLAEPMQPVARRGDEADFGNMREPRQPVARR
eukprot:CAMPEP_0117585700 /NCGR_PEP_ID=MMETSP0784-20121206/68298_1 /TAXON_ID=39447 /ORGANISM="" /LENGTH=438 /DNA_ID=CAMNT_0005386691 /DNA_START=79 /DNA_END=1392 /DNA_ORIENTATION=+